MPRRREPDLPPEPVVSARLARFRVSDWYEPADLNQSSSTTSGPVGVDPLEAAAANAGIKAYRRWKDARREAGLE